MSSMDIVGLAEGAALMQTKAESLFAATKRYTTATQTYDKLAAMKAGSIGSVSITFSGKKEGAARAGEINLIYYGSAEDFLDLALEISRNTCASIHAEIQAMKDAL